VTGSPTSRRRPTRRLRWPPSSKSERIAAEKKKVGRPAQGEGGRGGRRGRGRKRSRRGSRPTASATRRWNSSTTGTRRKWALVIGGLGIGGLRAGGYFGYTARNAQTSFDNAGCGDPATLLDQTQLATCRQNRDNRQARRVAVQRVRRRRRRPVADLRHPVRDRSGQRRTSRPACSRHGVAELHPGGAPCSLASSVLSGSCSVARGSRWWRAASTSTSSAIATATATRTAVEPDETCVLDTCTQKSCSSTTDCGPGFEFGCTGGVCTVQTCTSSDCGLGFACSAGFCVASFNVASAASATSASITVTFDAPPDSAKRRRSRNYSVSGLTLSARRRCPATPSRSHLGAVGDELHRHGFGSYARERRRVADRRHGHVHRPHGRSTSRARPR